MPTRRIAGIKASIPAGYVLGRTQGGEGDVGLISITDLGHQMVGSGAIQPGSGGSSIVVAGTDVVSVSLSGSTYTVALTPGTAKQYLRENSGATGHEWTSHGEFDELIITGVGGSGFTVAEDGGASPKMDVVWASYGSGATQTSVLQLGRARGTSASPSAIQNGDILGTIDWNGYGTGFAFGAQIQAVATENWTATANGAELQFYTMPNGSHAFSGTPPMKMANDGGLVLAGATGGDKGLGSLNATGLFINGSAVNAGTLGDVVWSKLAQLNQWDATRNYTQGQITRYLTDWYICTANVSATAGTAPSVDGSPATAHQSSGTTLAVSLTTPTANDLLIAVFAISNNNIGGGAQQVSSIAGTNTSGWARQNRVVSTSNNCSLEVWTGQAAGALTAQSITATMDNLQEHTCMMVFGVKGAQSIYSPGDSNASLPATNFGGASTAVPNVSGLTTDETSDLLLAAMAIVDNSGHTFAETPTSYTQIGSNVQDSPEILAVFRNTGTWAASTVTGGDATKPNLSWQMVAWAIRGTSATTVPSSDTTHWCKLAGSQTTDLSLLGTTTGQIDLKAPANASGTITLPNGTTDFSATGGASQVVKQTSAGGALTVGQLATSDLSDFTTFTTDTPTVTATVGTFTTVSGTQRFMKIGKLAHIIGSITITTNGTAAGQIKVTLPTGLTLTGSIVGCGRANTVSGKELVVFLADATHLAITNYDFTYPGSNGEVLVFSIFSETT